MGESGQATIASSALGDYVGSLSGVTDIFPAVEAIGKRGKRFLLNSALMIYYMGFYRHFHAICIRFQTG